VTVLSAHERLFCRAGRPSWLGGRSKDYFPYTAQNATLAISNMTLYARNQGMPTPAPKQVPGTTTTDLQNSRKTTLTFTQESTVLKKDAPDVFLIIQYSVSGL
jgi:hypothetical protein